VTIPAPYDVLVIGAGPAGSAAAHAAVSAGARTLLLDRADVPRYKCCGGGLIGVSTRHTADSGVDLGPLTRDAVTRMTFSKEGRQTYTRRARGPIFRLVMRADFDAALVSAAVAAGASLRTGVAVRSLAESPDGVAVTLASGEVLRAAAVVGADGSGGRTGGHVGVRLAQVDVGLEGEFPTPPVRAAYWRGRAHIDWGPVPGSYGWVFPKGALLTVGVIGPRAEGAAMRAYYEAFVERVGLGGVQPATFSGHLTRCREPGSPLRRGNVLVAGDAAGLLEPWTREGISYALRSGRAAGLAAASGDPAAYERYVAAELEPEMAAGRAFLAAFSRNRQVFHGFLASVPGGWRLFSRLVAGETTLERQMRKPYVRALIRALG
jgi:geranylgeranyl reductase family protein